MRKERYAVNEQNRLVIRRGKSKLVPAGSFALHNNVLYYWLNEPPDWRRENFLPKKIKFIGTWKLDKNRDLVLDLSQGKNDRRADTLTLHGRILPAQGDVLAFALASDQPGHKKEYRILQLAGAWKASEQNGLFFEAKKHASPDVLSLGMGWKLDKKQQVVYNYEKIDLLTRKKSAHTVEFRGSWQITRKNLLTYILERGTSSRFDFRVQAESLNLYPQKGVIKFRLGTGVRQTARKEPSKIALFGTWKFGKSLSLEFELGCGQGRVSALRFGTDIDLSRKDKVVFSLVDNQRRFLGMQVVFSHRFLKKLDAEAFLRIKRLRDEFTVDLGVSVPF